MSFLALETLVFIDAFPRGLVADTDVETSAVPLWNLLRVVHSGWCLAMVQSIEDAGFVAACLERAVGFAFGRQLATLMRHSCKCTRRSATNAARGCP